MPDIKEECRNGHDQDVEPIVRILIAQVSSFKGLLGDDRTIFNSAIITELQRFCTPWFLVLTFLRAAVSQKKI